MLSYVFQAIFKLMAFRVIFPAWISLGTQSCMYKYLFNMLPWMASRCCKLNMSKNPISDFSTHHKSDPHTTISNTTNWNIIFLLTIWKILKFFISLFLCYFTVNLSALLHILTLKYNLTTSHHCYCYLQCRGNHFIQPGYYSNSLCVSLLCLPSHCPNAHSQWTSRMTVLHISQMISVICLNPSNNFPSQRSSQRLYNDLQGPRWSAHQYSSYFLPLPVLLWPKFTPFQSPQMSPSLYPPSTWNDPAKISKRLVPLASSRDQWGLPGHLHKMAPFFHAPQYSLAFLICFSFLHNIHQYLIIYLHVYYVFSHFNPL